MAPPSWWDWIRKSGRAHSGQCLAQLKNTNMNSCWGCYYHEDIFQFDASSISIGLWRGVCKQPWEFWSVPEDFLNREPKTSRWVHTMAPKQFFQKECNREAISWRHVLGIAMSRRLASELERLAQLTQDVCREEREQRQSGPGRGALGPWSWRPHFLWDLGFRRELFFNICKGGKWTKLPLNSVFYRSYFYAFVHYIELILLAFLSYENMCLVTN